jgi:hypothetical protein
LCSQLSDLLCELSFREEGLPRTPSTEVNEESLPLTAVNEERLPRASSTEVNEESLPLTEVNEERLPRAPSTEVNGERERLPRAPLTKVNGEHLLRAPLTEVNRNRTVDPEGACVLGKIMSDEGCDDDDEILVTKENFPKIFFRLSHCLVNLGVKTRTETVEGFTRKWRGLLRKLFKQNNYVVKCECGKKVKRWTKAGAVIKHIERKHQNEETKQITLDMEVFSLEGI